MTRIDTATAAAPGAAVAAPASRQPRTRPVDPRLLRYSRASRGFFAASAVIALGQTAATVAFAWLLSTTLVGAIQGAPPARLVPGLGGATALVVVRAALIAASERVCATGAARASLQLRAAVVAAVQRLGPAGLADRSPATLAITAGHGLEALEPYFGRYLPQLVATVVATPILVVAILVADPVSGIIVVGTMPLIPIFMVLIGLATRSVQRRQFDTLQRLAARFADTVGGLGTLTVFGRQHRAAASIETVTDDYKRETMGVLRVSFLSGFALEFLASISVAIVAVTIGLRLLGGEMGLLVGLFVLLLAPEAYLPLRQVGVQFHAAAEGVAATDRVFEVLDAAASIAEEKMPDRSPVAERARRARDDAPAPIVEAHGLRVVRGARPLPAVDLSVRSGEVVLVAGPSGVGKSSLLAALLGFAPFEGAILVDGEERSDARDVLAWAGQRPGLVSGRVLANVTLGDPEPGRALARSCLDDAALPDLALDVELGAGGSGLSGGQAQRVAAARALYRLRRGRAAVLALDEPSSALDATTEAALWRTLRAEADAGAGVLLVSHRATARRIADRVVRLGGEG